jgi:hypothetical protein
MKSGRMIWSGHAARIGKVRNVFNIFVQKRSLGGPRRRWEDNTRMDLREVGWEGAHWIHLTQNRNHLWTFVNTAMKLRVPQRRVNSWLAE